MVQPNFLNEKSTTNFFKKNAHQHAKNIIYTKNYEMHQKKLELGNHID